MTTPELPLATRLNLETARITWSELERFFARGRVLAVANNLDLIQVASALTSDDVTQFQRWTQSAQVVHLSNETAKRWLADDTNLWAVVIAPWVLVQERVA